MKKEKLIKMLSKTMNIYSEFLINLRVTIILGLLVGWVLFSCDKRKDYFRNNHENTTINLRLLNAHSTESATIDTDSKTITDTVKIGFNYLFEFQLTDKYPVQIQSEGQGDLYINSKGYYIPFKNTELTQGTFKFNWIPNLGAGDYHFSLSFTDDFGNTTKYDFYLHVFLNRVPQIEWDLVPVGEKGDLHYRFTTTGQDGDHLYGGLIKYYEFVVNQDTTLYSNSYMDYVFPKEGFYALSVRALDSNDEWSNFSQISSYYVAKIEDDSW